MLKLGQQITYYCETHCRYTTGTITALDVRVLWLSGHPLGVQINGSLTRPYNQVQAQ